MVVRSAVRDVLILYLSYEIFQGYISGKFTITEPILISVIVLCFFVILFWLEKIGILPKMGI